MPGQKTTLLDPENFVDALLGNRGGNTVQITPDAAANQMISDGPLFDALAGLAGQITATTITRGQWAGLLTTVGTLDGQGAEVLDQDAGTHLAATATGYDGAATPNAGRYSWNAAWARWVRLGGTGLSAKADAASTAAALAAKADAAATTAALAGKATAAQGLKADSAVQPAALAAEATDRATQDVRAQILDTARAETREAWSAATTGEPEARAAITQGTIVTAAPFGTVLQISGAQVPGAGYLDIAPRKVWSALPGRTYLVSAFYRRSAAPADPEGHAVQVAVQQLSETKADLGVEVIDTRAANVIGALQAVTFTASLDQIAECTITGPYWLPFFRLFGQDALHSVQFIEVAVLEITATAGLSAAVAGVASALALKADQTALEAVEADSIAAEYLLGVAIDEEADARAAADLLKVATADLSGPLRFANPAAPDTQDRPRGVFSALMPLLGWITFSASGAVLFNELRFRYRARSLRDYPYVAAIFDARKKYTLLRWNAKGEAGFVPDAETTGRFADVICGVSANAALANLLPGNVFGGQVYNRRFNRFYSDTSGQVRAYLGRRRNPKVYLEEGRGKGRWVPALGDSSSQGSGATPLLTDVPATPNSGLMLSSGIRGTGNVPFVPAAAGDFAPAVERLDSSGILGSTGWAAYLMMREYLQSQGGERTFSVVHTSGQSGYTLDQMVEGQTPFENSIVAASRAVQIAETYGRGMEAFSVFVRNGANDRSAARTLAAYKADLVALQASFTARFGAVFGQTRQIQLFQTQLAAPNNLGPGVSEIGQAQYEAAIENANIHLVATEYEFPFSPANNVHGSIVKYNLLCEKCAIAEWAYERHGISTFCPMSDFPASGLAGAVYTLRGDAVPKMTGGWWAIGKTTADRVQAEHDGFALSDTGGATISSVVITDDGSSDGTWAIAITLSQAPAGGATLEYAYTGELEATDYSSAWGNIADNCTLPSQIMPGREHINYLHSFRKVIS